MSAAAILRGRHLLAFDCVERGPHGHGSAIEVAGEALICVTCITEICCSAPEEETFECPECYPYACPGDGGRVPEQRRGVRAHSHRPQSGVVSVTTVRLFHCTDPESAEAIESVGFVDGEGQYGMRAVHRGVWFCDEPFAAAIGLTSNMSALTSCRIGRRGKDGKVRATKREADGTVPTFEVDADEARLPEWEWVEEGKTYREWLIPAEVANTWPRRRVKVTLGSPDGSTDFGATL